MPAIATPLANRKPGGINFVVVGENIEGEYWSVGGSSILDRTTAHWEKYRGNNPGRWFG